MTVMGLNFTKMLAVKNKPVKGKININNNISIKDVSESKLTIDNKRKSLKFVFEYSAVYEPGIGSIEIAGETVYLTEEKLAKETLDRWKKDKSIPSSVSKDLMNQVLAKCNVQAVVLSKEINLPAPIPMPKMK